jgi:hypothetical protein
MNLPKKDFHQGRFPGTVLSEKRMNVPINDGHVNMIIGNVVTKYLCDLMCLDCVGHKNSSSHKK